MKKIALKNPFAKQKEQKRAADGKFTAGSGGLKSLKRFNWKRSLPVIVIVALVGGLLIFRSFAAVTKPPRYQYSAFTCVSGAQIPDVASLNDQQKKCIDESAEALTYRLQAAAMDTQSTWGYNHWTQRLAGDRATYSHVAAEIEAVPAVRWGSLSDKDYVEKVAGVAKPAQKADWTKQIQAKKLTRDQLAQNVANLFKISKNKAMMSSYKYNNVQFVDHIFVNLLGRQQASTNGQKVPVVDSNSYWVKQLDSEKMSRPRVLIGIALSSEAITKSRANAIKYINTQPKPKVTQTAAANQKKRESTLVQYVKAAKAYSDAADSNAKKANALVAKAQDIANKSNGSSRSTLDSIASLQHQAESYQKTAQTNANNAQKYLTKANAVLKTAQAVTKYSPDIPDSAIKTNRDKVIVYATFAKGRAKDIGTYISRISASYTVARNKYEAEQRRIAEEAARRAAEEAANQGGGSGGGGSGGGGGGGSNLDPNGCSTPANQIHSGMGANCTAKFQAAYGLAVDGIWGPKTTAKYNEVHRTGQQPPSDLEIKNRLCQSLYEVNWSPSKGRCDTPTNSGGGGSTTLTCNSNQTKINGRCVTAQRLPTPFCYNLSNTDLHTKHCTDMKAMSESSSRGDTAYYKRRRWCTKQFGTLRNCKWYSGYWYYNW